MTLTTMDSLLDKLNPHQKEAAIHQRGPLLVLAGAGSGKTRVLTHKIAHMLQQGVMPESILAVTFTNKAAKEMRSRVEDIVQDIAPERAIGTMKNRFWIGTFHGICGRILRNEIGHYQTPSGRTWTNRFVIYDETESMAAMKAVIKAHNLDEKLYSPKSIRYMISGFKNQMLDAYQYASNAKDFKAEKLAQLFDSYEQELCRNNALDFDDLLLMTVKLFTQNPDRLQRYHHQFEHILVDEFQDTNDAQYELIRLLVEGCRKEEKDPNLHRTLWQNRSLTVVGDVDQSIYSWRGANFKIILNFQKDFPDAALIKLQENYRSTKNILEVANQIIENNAERLPKDLLSTRGEGEKVHCFEARDDREEALYLVDKMLQVTQSSQFKPGQCCFLYRTNQQSRTLEDVLISRGLPYNVIGGMKFYERREIKDVIAYLTVIFNDQDGYSVKRVLNVPKRGVGKTSIEKIEAIANQENFSFYYVLKQADQVSDLQPKAKKAIAGFVSTVEMLKMNAESLPLDQLMVQVLESSGYYDELKAEDPTDSEGRIGNVEEFVNVARQFETEQQENGSQGSSSLADFLMQMALLSDIDSAEPAENKFVLMTLHAAKGLEFPVIAISGLEEGLFPHFRSLNDKDGMEEERRLMYVGVTRAEERLFLSYARRRMVFGEVKYTTPSRFLKEIPPHLLTGSYNLDQDTRRSVDDVRTGGRSAPGQQGYDYQDRDYEPDYAQDDGWSQNNRSKSSGSGYQPNRWGNPKPQARPKATTGLPPKTGVSPKPGVTHTNRNTPGSGVNDPVQAAFANGDTVSHPKFGVGTVMQVLGDSERAIFNVQFEGIAGRKLMDGSKLEKM
jgi:DNA helicase-2/ATP-dependent DNA helicase PcrA